MSPPAHGESRRIAPVDGLRAVAAVGVLWAHVWAFVGNPKMPLGTLGSVTLDMNRAVAVVGTGVDLFFVISGFCMYLMYAGSQSSFSWLAFGYFVRRRWLRIAPAFYAAAAAVAIGYYIAGRGFPWLELFSHITFLNTIVPGMGGLAAPFWSLATEWHFYLVLPVCVWATGRIGFWATIAILAACSLAFRAWIFSAHPSGLIDWHAQLPARLIEFGWGICVARLYANGTPLPRILSGGVGFMLGAAVAYTGRALAVTEVVKLAGEYGPLLRVFSEPVLAFGYAIILWNLVCANSLFGRCLSHGSLRALGRWSYSLYLWHWWPAVWICGLTRAVLGSTVAAQILAFAISLGVLIPLAWISYRLFEAPYFEGRRSSGNPKDVSRSGV